MIHLKNQYLWQVICSGNFEFFVHCLNQNVRIKPSKDLSIHSFHLKLNGRTLDEIIFVTDKFHRKNNYVI